jgi:hypothetical protein
LISVRGHLALGKNCRLQDATSKAKPRLIVPYLLLLNLPACFPLTNIKLYRAKTEIPSWVA